MFDAFHSHWPLGSDASWYVTGKRTAQTVQTSTTWKALVLSLSFLRHKAQTFQCYLASSCCQFRVKSHAIRLYSAIFQKNRSQSAINNIGHPEFQQDIFRQISQFCIALLRLYPGCAGLAGLMMIMHCWVNSSSIGICLFNYQKRWWIILPIQIMKQIL